MSSNLASPTKPLHAAADRAGVVPAQGIARMLARGRDHRRRALRARPDPAGEPRPPPRRARPSGSAPPSCPARRRSPSGWPSSTMHRIDLAPGAVLEKGCVYVVPLVEGLALPAGRLRRRQRQELDRPARPLHPADHRPRQRVRPHRAGLRRPALRRDLAALVLGAGPPGHAAQPDPLPPRRTPSSTTPRSARLDAARAAGRRRRRTSPAASPSPSTSSRAGTASSATAPSRTPG